MNSSSCSCQCRSADAAPALMRVMLTPNWVNPTASPIFCFSRPAMTGANSFGYDAICCAGIFAMSIFGIMASQLHSEMRHSHPFDDRRGTHAGADAQRHQCGRKVASFQFVDHGTEDHRAGGAERMAHGDRPAVDVHFGEIK